MRLNAREPVCGEYWLHSVWGGTMRVSVPAHVYGDSNLLVCVSRNACPASLWFIPTIGMLQSVAERLIVWCSVLQRVSFCFFLFLVIHSHYRVSFKTLISRKNEKPKEKKKQVRRSIGGSPNLIRGMCVCVSVRGYVYTRCIFVYANWIRVNSPRQVTYCTSLHSTATHCNTLQHTATVRSSSWGQKSV